jgi:hypothetical protein
MFALFVPNPTYFVMVMSISFKVMNLHIVTCLIIVLVGTFVIIRYNNTLNLSMGFPSPRTEQKVWCHNFRFGLTTKANAYKGACQEWSMGVTFHALENVGECEGMNLHIPKWTATLGVGVLMNSWIFRRWWKGSKLIGLKNSLYHWKALGT